LPKIKPFAPHKIIKVLEKAGFKVVRKKGSHVIMINDKGTRIVVPVHPGKDVQPGLVRAIIKETALSKEDFLKFLKKV
jgi:predicted RNA binding protein YcfA (HicA-like mRNA interferase family)